MERPQSNLRPLRRESNVLTITLPRRASTLTSSVAVCGDGSAYLMGCVRVCVRVTLMCRGYTCIRIMLVCGTKVTTEFSYFVIDVSGNPDPPTAKETSPSRGMVDLQYFRLSFPTISIAVQKWLYGSKCRFE